MEAFTSGQIALIAFPFSDLTSVKLRPAVIVSTLNQGDCLLCQITSKPYDGLAVLLEENDFVHNALRQTSYARPGKLFTAHHSLLTRQIGQLSENGLDRLREKIIAVIRGEHQ